MTFKGPERWLTITDKIKTSLCGKCLILLSVLFVATADLSRMLIILIKPLEIS